MKNKCLLLFLWGLCITAHAQQYVEDSIKIDGKMRQFVLYLPDGIQQDAPLVFYLHGYGGSIQRKNPMIGTADREKFAVCIPQGLKDPKGKNSWNVGYPFQEGWKQNDVRALCKMARYVQKHYRLSRENTFLTGMSNGGEMSYLMAYAKQRTFKAVAPIAGLTMLWMYQDMEASRPIPLFEIHGTEDRVSEWTGDLENKGGWGAYMPVPLAVGYWVAKNRCAEEKTERTESLNKDNGHYIIKHKFTRSATGCDVWLYEVVGGEHSTHTTDLNTGNEIWDFFRQYIKGEKVKR